MTAESRVDIKGIVDRVGPIAREHAEESERLRQLAKPVVDVMIEQRVFKCLVPRSLGGLESASKILLGLPPESPMILL